MSLNRFDSLARATKQLMFDEPFYGMFLLMLNRRWESSGTASVQRIEKVIRKAGVEKRNIKYDIVINELWWDTLSEIQRKGLLKHELLHIAFFHLTDYDHIPREHDEILNIAMDIEINQYIDRTWLPPGPMLPESFPELKLEPKKGTMYYYEKLLQAQQGGSNGKSKNLEICIVAMKEGKNEVQLSNGSVVSLPDHMWDAFQESSEAEKRLIKTHIENALQEVAEQVEKSRGTIPGEIQQILKRMADIEPPRFDWKGYLRRFYQGSTQVYTKKLRRKPNKRYTDNPGLKLKPKKHVLVAVDTSGSVSRQELQEFFEEIHHIHRTGAQVTIVQCDTAICHMGPYKPKDEIHIHGRGGTDFQPVIDYFDENRKTYSCLIYLTDGEAPAPTKPRGRILWALSSASRKTEHLPGYTIKLN
jgi:predicted metal-dependent peptidase